MSKELLDDGPDPKKGGQGGRKRGQEGGGRTNWGTEWAAGMLTERPSLQNRLMTAGPLVVVEKLRGVERLTSPGWESGLS